MLITTTRGDMDDALLEKRAGEFDNENECTQWVEYWFTDGGGADCQHVTPSGPDLRCPKGCGAELGHRSVNMRLKQAVVFAVGAAGGLG